MFSGESHEVYSGVKIIQANGEQSKSVRSYNPNHLYNIWYPKKGHDLLLQYYFKFISL